LPVVQVVVRDYVGTSLRNCGWYAWMGAILCIFL